MPSTISILIDCSNQSVEFIVASAKNVTVYDIVRPLYVPSILKSFFPLNDANGHDGHSLPLLYVQVTEILDGIFIGCSLNHSIRDGTSFGHFLNSWSEISRNDSTNISSPPIFDRSFLDPGSFLIRLPFKDHREFIKRSSPHTENLVECLFNFSASTISKLKAKANLEMDIDKISSLQALLAHVWKFIIRAWKLKPDHEVRFCIPIGNRSRIKPPLPNAYFGNSLSGSEVKELAGVVMSKGIGFTAWKMNKTCASMTNEIIKNSLDSWVDHPFIFHPEMFKAYTIYVMNSPRFNVYGNNFGWGRPIAVRSGSASKLDGMISVFQGDEEGSIGLQVCLVEHAMLSLLKDKEFMSTCQCLQGAEEEGSIPL